MRAVALTGLLAVVGTLSTGAPSARAADSPYVVRDSRKVIARVTADPRRPAARAIPGSFVGYSVEFSSLKNLTGVPATGVNPVARELFDAITRRGQGPPSIRVGGGTTDNAWYNPAMQPHPPDTGLFFSVERSFLAGLDQFTRATGSKVIFGLNLAVNRPDMAADMAKAVLATLGPKRLEAFEVGNEPDFYPDRPLYDRPDGSRAYARPKGYGVDEYLTETDQYRAALRSVRGPVKLAGPSSLPVPAWTAGMERILRRQRSDVGMVTTHEYPLSACEDRTNKARPTLGALLQPSILRGATQRALTSARLARRYGMEFRVTETNSAACGGARRVSDVFGAALWATDWMLHLAATGADGLNFHTSGSNYRPFFFAYRNGRVAAAVMPVYYAGLFFAEAAPHGSRMLPSAFFPRISKDGNLSTFATYDRRRGLVRVAILFKGGRRNGDVIVRIPGAGRRASVKRLEAPSFFSRQGVTWGGQTIPNPTFDGKLRGDARIQKVRRRKGTFRVHAEVPSAVLLTARVGKPRR